MSILPELVAYLRRPVFTASHVPMNGQALAELFKLLGITLVLALLSVMITSGLYSAVSGDTPEVSQDFEALTKSGQLFFMAVIYAPLTEELLFRSWLGRRWGLLFVMPLILALSAALALSGQSEAAPDMSAISIIIVMGSLGFYLQRYFSTKRMEGLHEQAALHIFPYAFWGTSIIFALIHMSNYAGTGFQPLLVLMVIPQFIIGLILGFVRMRYGLPQAIGFHAAYNSVFVGLAMLGQAAS